MTVDSLLIRPVSQSDHAPWRLLWDGYNAFYGREGETALPEAITTCTWKRFLDPAEPVFALVAELDGEIVGLAHYLFHRSTTRIEPVCYLQDLFTRTDLRGRGVGRQLIGAVYHRARDAGARRRRATRLLADADRQCRRAGAVRQGGAPPGLHRLYARDRLKRGLVCGSGLRRQRRHQPFC